MTTTPDKVERELHSLEPSAIIELFELHLTAAVNGVNLVYYYHAGTNELSQDIVFNGVTYSAVPIEVDGFKVTTKGTLPRPRMKIANANNAITALLNTYNPLQAEVRRIRTCKKFLDAVNFSSGSNPTADPTATFGSGYESWYIDRVASENPELVEFELVGKLDLTNLRLPVTFSKRSGHWTWRQAVAVWWVPRCKTSGLTQNSTQQDPRQMNVAVSWLMASIGLVEMWRMTLVLTLPLTQETMR